MDRLGTVPESSEDGAQDNVERSARRYNLVIRPAKLVSPQGEFVCIIRDVSESGISVRSFHRLPAGDRMALEMQTGDAHEIEKVWEDGKDAGFRFLGKCDVESVVREAGSFPKRRLRLRVALPIEITTLAGRSEGMIENLSQQGAQVTCATVFARDQMVRLKGPKLPEISAKVRWRDDGRYGLVFENTFALEQLARLAASLQAPGLLED